MALRRKNIVIKALMIDAIREIAVYGFLIFLNNGSSKATKPPTIIEIKYFGYLATLEKNSPINATNRIVF